MVGYRWFLCAWLRLTLCFSVDSDLLELNVKVKKMNLITEATAMVLSHEATQRHGTEANRLFQEAIRKFNVSHTGGHCMRKFSWTCGKCGKHAEIRDTCRKSACYALMFVHFLRSVCAPVNPLHFPE